MFGRVGLHGAFALHANFQLGYLAQMHQRDFNSAYAHYGKALGPAYSAHFVRTTRHLAHLDYLTNHHDKALERLHDLVANDEAITAFTADLAKVNGEQKWSDRSRSLEAALNLHGPLLAK